MEIVSTYSVKVKDYNQIFRDSVSLYRQAVDWFIDVVLNEWDDIQSVSGMKERKTFVESLTISSKSHPNPKYDFSSAFYKFPSYLRRAAITEAIGKVSSYQSNLKNWQANPVGKEPGKPSAGFIYPALYDKNMYVRTDAYEARVKIWIRNTWDWIAVKMKKSDVDYITHHCASSKECAPTLQKRGKQWFLDFAFKDNVKLNEVPVEQQIAVAVDLGINNACTCSVMKSDGTVIGRKFLHLPVENDCLNHRLNKIRQAQQRGNTHIPRLWASVNGMNERISILTAQFIINVAVEYDAHVIVFEHLDTNKKKRGLKKQRLHFWKANYVQNLVTHKAHKLGMRISRICAWNTSRLASDGTGRVKRGKEVSATTSYSECVFQSGKHYNCDLNASYNIGARYFVRERLKSLSETSRLAVLAKVPELARRTTCTLSSLIRLSAAM